MSYSILQFTHVLSILFSPTEDVKGMLFLNLTLKIVNNYKNFNFDGFSFTETKKLRAHGLKFKRFSFDSLIAEHAF
jgi:hypothetical protein